MRTLPLLAVSLLLPFTLRAADSADAKPDSLQTKMESLQKVGEDFAAASSMPANALAGSAAGSLRALAAEYRDFSSNFSSLQSNVQEGNYDYAIRALQRWLGRTKNEQVKTALSDLLVALKKEKEARDAKLAAQVDEFLKKINQATVAAKTAEEVAGIMAQVEDFRDTELNTGGRSQVLNNRVGRVTSFLSSWQQVLLAEQSGDYSSALQSLSSLRRSGYSVALLDADALSAKFQQLLAASMQKADSSKNESPVLRGVAQIVEQVKTPADAERATTAMANLSSYSYGSENRLVNSLQAQLSELARMNADFESGAYSRVVSYNSYNPNYAVVRGLGDQLQKMSDTLRAQAVAVGYDLPDLGVPQAKESFPAFLRRQAQAAFDKKDWQRLYTLLSVQSTVGSGSCFRTADQKQGTEAFLAGQQLEEAGQFREAVARYSQCIAEIGKLVPRAEATAALARLRKEHPEAFAQTENAGTK